LKPGLKDGLRRKRRILHKIEANDINFIFGKFISRDEIDNKRTDDTNYGGV